MLKTHFVQVAISHGTTVPGMVYWSVWSMDHRYSASHMAPAFDFMFTLLAGKRAFV